MAENVQSILKYYKSYKAFDYPSLIIIIFNIFNGLYVKKKQVLYQFELC